MSVPTLLEFDLNARSLDADRRNGERFPCNVMVCCRPVGGPGARHNWPTTIFNVSRGGVGLVVRRRFEPNTLLFIDLQITTTES